MKGQKYSGSYPVIPTEQHSALLGHELGNVLHGLLGMAELLGQTRLTAEQSQWLSAIVQSGLQMQALIQPGRLLAEMPGGVTAPGRRIVDGVQLLERVLTSHRPAAQSRSNRLFMTMAADVPRYWNCDACMVRQLLDNVLGNAIKFTRAGDIHLEVLAEPAGRTLLLRISDTGPGIGNKHTELRNTIGCGNRGLGLYICRQIISAMNGQLNIANSGDAGTRIEMSLPEVLEDCAARPPACSLFGLVRCGLELREPLFSCVHNVLDRLGVEWTAGEPDYSGTRLCVSLRELSRQSGSGDRHLLLSPVPARDAVPARRVTAMQLTESSLGSLLMELVIEWRRRSVSCDIAD